MLLSLLVFIIDPNLKSWPLFLVIDYKDDYFLSFLGIYYIIYKELPNFWYLLNNNTSLRSDTFNYGSLDNKA